MGDKTGIEWTDATWNPTTGCDRISPGCDHCYALTMAARLKLMGSARYQHDGDPATSGPGFGLSVHPDALEIPLRWTRPRRIFVNSMSDLFHTDVPEDFIERVFLVMREARQHTFQVLSKRPQRMARVVDAIYRRWSGGDAPRPLPNVWLGTSIENQTYAWRTRHLLDTPAAVRFLSVEPLLGPLTLKPTYLDGLDWVIVGGESGKGARPMHPDWVRSLQIECSRHGVAFHFKQWGSWAPLGPLYDQDDDYDEQADTARMEAASLEVMERKAVVELETDGTIVYGYQPGDHRTWLMAELGKKRTGRDLDGRTWDEYPSSLVPA